MIQECKDMFKWILKQVVLCLQDQEPVLVLLQDHKQILVHLQVLDLYQLIWELVKQDKEDQMVKEKV